MYYVKAIGGGNNVSSGNAGIYGEQEDNQVLTINPNLNTTNINSDENRVAIDVNFDNSINLYAQNSNQSGYYYNNRYYYNFLNEYSKVIYDAIVNNIDKLKSGNYQIDIDYDFSSIWNNANGGDYLKDYYDDAVNAVNLDIPDLFYIDFSKMYLNIEKTSSLFSTKYRLYISSGKYSNYYFDGFTSQEQVELAIKQVENLKTQVKALATGDDYNQAKKIHDWLIEYMSYEASSNNRASVYGAFIEKKGVCESYARTFKYILDDLGIENILVTGTATNSNGVTEDHMWNYVKINNDWYAVDVTWDDPIVIGGGTVSDEVKHKYFLVGSQEFYKNHSEKLAISLSGRTFPLPTLSRSNL